MKGKFVASARHLGRSIWKNRACYSLMLPGIIWFILFAYGPMSGLLLAFKTYSARGGIWGSPWCGFENFAYVFIAVFKIKAHIRRSGTSRNNQR